jgi:pyruvate formate lyase activating enzyme
MSAADILAIAEKDRVFYGDTGGVTLSGGEPLAHKEAAVALLKACKENGLSTAVETCGYVLPETLCAAIPYTDLFLWDLKDTNDTRHRQYTGVSNQTILDNLQLADAHGARIRLRCILVNGVNSDPEHYTRVADIAETLSGLEGVEILPYHAYAGTKAVFLGYEDNGNPDWIPPAEEISRMKQVLKDRGIPVL